MSNFVNTIDLLGDEATAKAIIEKTITEFNDDILTEIGSNAFSRCASLASVNMPNLTKIGNAGFWVCSSLSDISIPKCTTLGEMALSNTAIKEIDLPLVTSISSQAFASCASLTDVNLPSLNTTLSNCFYICQSLSNVNIPNVTGLGTYAFASCPNLTKLDLPNVNTLKSKSFDTCSNLKTIILRKNEVCTLARADAFANTPFAEGGTGGTVYVPSALITDYQNATNWSTLYAAGTCNFVAIEGSEYE